MQYLEVEGVTKMIDLNFRNIPEVAVAHAVLRASLHPERKPIPFSDLPLTGNEINVTIIEEKATQRRTRMLEEGVIVPASATHLISLFRLRQFQSLEKMKLLTTEPFCKTCLKPCKKDRFWGLDAGAPCVTDGVPQTDISLVYVFPTKRPT